MQTQHHREATAAELKDVEQMLRARGVAPVVDSILRLGDAQGKRPAGNGLWSIVTSFRADRAAAKSKASKSSRLQTSRSRGSQPTDVLVSILRERGHDKDCIAHALAVHGPDLEKCMETCQGPNMSEPDPSASIATDEDWAANVIQGLGFSEAVTTQALEACDFSFSDALVLLFSATTGTKPSTLE